MTTRLQALQGKPVQSQARANYEELARRQSVTLEQQQREAAARRRWYTILRATFAGATREALERLESQRQKNRR